MLSVTCGSQTDRSNSGVAVRGGFICVHPARIERPMALTLWVGFVTLILNLLEFVISKEYICKPYRGIRL